MALIRRRGDGWYVQWKELVVLQDADGATRREWKTRARTVPTHEAAKTLAREIETAHALGRAWKDTREEAKATLRSVVLAYMRAAVDAGAPIATQRFRSSMLGSFLDFIRARDEEDAGVDTPVTELTLALLERYARWLPGEGRQAQTRYRKVMEVERMWAWGYDRPERFPGMPVPRRYTGGSSDSDKLSAPPPVVAVAAPTWADVDAMMAQLTLEWHRRIALVMRFTGLRASQACGLEWRDFDLDRKVLFVRARVRGAKRSRARVLPLHPELVADMAGWGAREGLLFPRRYKDQQTGQPRSGPYRGDALVEPFRRAWTLAKVPKDRWDVPDDEEGERSKGSPTHAIRRCIRTQLIRAGVEEAIVLYLVGQTQGITAAAYVPETSPEQSPYWPRLVEAVGLIPPTGKVLRLEAPASASPAAAG